MRRLCAGRPLRRPQLGSRNWLATLPSEHYTRLVQDGDISRDAHQLEALVALDRVFVELESYEVPNIEEEAVSGKEGIVG